MWKRVAPVYMVSPMASICETYRHSEQKQVSKFCTSKREKNTKTHPEKPKVGETVCVLGAGEDESGKKRLRMDARRRHRMQHKAGKLDRIQTSLSTKNPQAMRFSQSLGTSGLAGAVRFELTARGFGVDVGERTREREKADVIRFPPKVPERAVLVWCCELFLEKDCVSTTTSSFERKAPPPGGWPS